MTMLSDSIALQIDKIIANKKSETEAWQTFRRSVMANGNATHDAKLALNNAIFSAYDAEREASAAIEQIVKRTVEDAQPHPNAYQTSRHSAQAAPHGGSSSGSGPGGGPGSGGSWHGSKPHIGSAGIPTRPSKAVTLANPNHSLDVHARYVKVGRDHYEPFPRGGYIKVHNKFVRLRDHRKNASEPFNVIQPDGSIRTYV